VFFVQPNGTLVNLNRVIAQDNDLGARLTNEETAVTSGFDWGADVVWAPPIDLRTNHRPHQTYAPSVRA
jgi:hypothetical protein